MVKTLPNKQFLCKIYKNLWHKNLERRVRLGDLRFFLVLRQQKLSATCRIKAKSGENDCFFSVQNDAT